MDESKPTCYRRQFVALTVAGAGAVGLWTVSQSGPSDANAGASRLGERFTYDLQALTKIDPELLTWEQANEIASQLVGATDLQVTAEGHIVVLRGRQIIDMDKTGRRRRTIELPEPAHAVHVAGQTIYVAMPDRIETFDFAGKRKGQWESIDGQPYLTCLASVAGAYLYAADAGNRVVHRYRTNGEHVGRITGPGQDDKFIVPSPFFDVCADHEGVWVADTGRRQIEAYGHDGTFREAWGKATMAIEGFGGCCNPSHFVRLGDGRFVTSEKGLNRVKVYEPDGKLDGVVAGPQQLDLVRPRTGTSTIDPAHSPPLIAADASGRVLVLSPLTGRLLAFTEK